MIFTTIMRCLFVARAIASDGDAGVRRVVRKRASVGITGHGRVGDAVKRQVRRKWERDAISTGIMEEQSNEVVWQAQEEFSEYDGGVPVSWQGQAEEGQAVSTPCDGACKRTTTGGLLIIGDSTSRRLYIRLISRLEGLTNEASEILQESAKKIAHGGYDANWSAESKAAVARFCGVSENGCDDMFNYTTAHARLRYAVAVRVDPESIASLVADAHRSGFHTVFIALPTAHLLYIPGSPFALACRAGSEFATHVSSKVEKTMGLVTSYSSMRQLYANGVPYATAGFDPRVECNLDDQNRRTKLNCTSGACDWLSNSIGVAKTNPFHKDTFDKLAKPFMRYVDLFGTTVSYARAHGFQQGAEFKLKGYESLGISVHYFYPVLDAQLEAIFTQALAA